jgi:hypothetical protein
MSPRKPKTDQKRLPRTRRAKNPPRFLITERDIEFLKALLPYRFLTIEQYQWMFPDASNQKLQTRLRLMYHHKFLERVLIPASRTVNKMIYSMTEKGAQLIAEEEGMTREDVPWNRHLNKITPGHIRHLLTINHVLISLQIALERAQVDGEVQSFKLLRAEPSRNRITVTLRTDRGHRRDSSVVPDAIMPIIFKGKKYEVFFIEVDRATMTTKKWQEKIAVYREYQRSQAMLDDYKKRGFVLLTVTTGDKRIDSLAGSTVAVGGQRGYWFTKLEDISPETCLNKVWIRASDLYDRRNEELVHLAKQRKPNKVSLLDAIRRDDV